MQILRCSVHEAVSFPQTRTCPLRPPHGYAELTAQGPLHRVEFVDGRTGWVVTRHEEARALLSDPRLSSDRADPGFPKISPRALVVRGQPPSFIGMDPPEHGRHRRMAISEFTVRRINALRPRIEEIAEQAAGRLRAAGPPADVVAHYALPIPSLVICEVLGVPYSDHEFFEDTSRRIARAGSDEETAASVRELAQYLDSLVEAATKRPGPGLIGKMVREELARGEITRESLVSTAMLLLAAGHETTANMIGLGIATLLEHPDQLAEFRADPDVVPGAVEEMLRYASVADTTGLRVATEDIEIAGRLIRAGEGVAIPNGPANFDPAVFPDPDTFDIHRGSRRHNAFGYGVHQCLGQNLARLELRVALPLLFERFPTLRLATPAADFEPRRPDVNQGLDTLTVTW
ncbi:cytochrome P450 [Streptomyces sp. NPDC048845]|uniref:cytochrome P450 n=1 Tax=Streptomyces sp. NPDC048845 TaxID=3155390 RepID=UPI00342E7D3B